jgi:DNA-binding MarR family transcriptional regulator/N-acetylglutamate synthase-like GNAT family acetyltransferase
MSAAAIAQVRSFNRTVAEGIGALEDRFLGRARPMGESRLLWEVGTDGADVRALRARLGLDSGYLSRLIQSLQRQRLVQVRADARDRRVRRVQLTKAGLAERHELDRRADAFARRMLDPLTDSQRATFLAAIGDVERLLRASMVRFAVERPTSADAQWCIGEYFKELAVRFERGFDPALTLRADAHELMPPAGAFYIARLHGRPVGCGAIKMHGRGPAELKRMWIAPDARGLGLGRRLLHELEQHARRAGASAVRLETNRALREAIALYRRTGYVEVEAFNAEPYAHHWFEKRF